MVGALKFCICIYVVFVANVFLCQGQFQCDDKFACINSTIAETSGDVWCYGLGSCAGSFIDNIGSAFDERTTGCWGGRSCQNAASFRGTVEYESDIRGYLGLAWSKYVNTPSLQCFGEGSCYQIENTTNDWLFCHGLRSCYAIYSHNTNYLVAGNGALSLQNSILQNPKSVRLMGFFSGYNATVYCESGYTCNVSCYSNGCENLRFICDDGANCTVYCNDTQGIDVTCPNGWNSSSIYNKNNNDYWIEEKSPNYQVLKMISSMIDDYILNNETNIYKRNKFAGECTTSNDIICGNNLECESMSILDKNNVCCSGHESCKYSTTENFDNVYCDASNACFERTLNGVINGSLQLRLSNIYARARYSTREGSIRNFNFIAATGQAATFDTTIESGNYLACLGRSSCYGTRIKSVANIYAGGQYALRYSRIVSGGIGEMNVYLLGQYSWLDMNISCTVGDVCNIYCINSECDDNIGNVTCDPAGSDCDINWIYSLPTNAPTKSPTGIPSLIPTTMPTVAPTIATRTTTSTTRKTATSEMPQAFNTTVPITTTNSDVTNIGSHSTNSLETNLTQSTISTTLTTSTSMRQEELYSTTDEKSDSTKEHENTSDDYVLYIVLLGLLVIMAICSGCLCWQKMRDNKAKDDDNKNKELEETIYIRSHSSINHSSKITPISPVSISPSCLVSSAPVNSEYSGNNHNESKNLNVMINGVDVDEMQSETVITKGIDQFSEGGERNSINTIVTQNEGNLREADNDNTRQIDHDEVNNNNSNPLLDDYTQEGGDGRGKDDFDDHGIAIDDENELENNARDCHDDTMRNKGEMFKQDLNDVILENAVMDDIVGHMATSGPSHV